MNYKILTDVDNGSVNNNIFYFYKIYQKYWKLIISISVIIALIVAFLVFFIMDPIYKSKATVKSTSTESSLSSLMGMTGLPGIGEFSELGGGGTLKELTLYENILLSRKCVEETILHFNLNAEWEFKYFEDAIKYFREAIIEIDKDKIGGTLDISVFDKNPLRAKEIVDFLIFKLNENYIEMNVMNAKNNRVFIESRYNLAKENLTAVEDSLKSYQDKYGVAPDIQIQASVKAELELESTLKSEEVKLDVLSKIFQKDQPEIKIQEEKIIALRNQLSAIQNNTQSESKLNLKGMPKVVIDYLRIKRELEIQNKILTTLIPLLEQSKIEENRNTPTVIVLDPAFVPEKKVKPKRLTLTALSFVLSFILSTILLIIYEKWKSFKEFINKSNSSQNANT